MPQETWEWDGTDWSQRTPSNAPSARTQACTAYDPTNRNVVLFGGKLLGGNPANDTWLWNGSNWAAASTTTAPPPATSGTYYHGMLFDPAIGGIVLFGDQANWLWDGRDWQALALPPVGFLARVAHDSRRNEIIVAGDFDTWIGTTAATAKATPRGAPCPGSPFAPSLVHVGLPRAGNAHFELRVGGPAMSQPSTVLISTAAASTSIFGCPLLVDPAGIVLAPALLTSSTGVVSLVLPIPSQPAFNGMRLSAQGAVWNSGVWRTSGALDLEIGR